jgi:hypothetical protein
VAVVVAAVVVVVAAVVVVVSVVVAAGASSSAGVVVAWSAVAALALSAVEAEASGVAASGSRGLPRECATRYRPAGASIATCKPSHVQKFKEPAAQAVGSFVARMIVDGFGP